MILPININNQPSFSASNPKRAARSIDELMNKLYQSAYGKELYSHKPDIIQISSRMRDGKVVTAVADFSGGKFVGLSFPYELVKYKREFCKKILNKYNTVVTKGKSNKHR